MVMNPGLIKFSKKPKIDKKQSTLEILCELLEKWGDVSADIIEYLASTNLDDPQAIQEQLVQCMNPDVFKELKQEMMIKN